MGHIERNLILVTGALELIVHNKSVYLILGQVHFEPRGAHTISHITHASHYTHTHSPSTDHPLRSVDEHSLPQQTTGSSSVVGESPISLSVGPTPIPSPQPSAASSQRSYYSQSGQRRRNHSFGHVSSSSDETIRASTTSLMSHASSSFGGHPRLLRTEVGDTVFDFINLSWLNG